MKKYSIIKVNSPSIFGGESKNQDRILYNPQTATCCVCDGTTSSPNSGEAASLVTKMSPLFVNSDIDHCMKTISDLLIAHRNMAIKKGIKSNVSVSDSMKDWIVTAAKENLKRSFQTTMVCAAFDPMETYTNVKVTTCGDSGFFCVSPEGKLLTTNLTDIEDKQKNNVKPAAEMIPFKPGTEIITKVMGQLSEFPDVNEKLDIQSTDKWLVCRTVCLRSYSKPEFIPQETSKLWLKPDDLLVVPKYLTSIPKDKKFSDFRILHYSRFIIPLSQAGDMEPEICFDNGNTTAVLPDHYYTGQWTFFEDRFPTNSNFILCSDGFYRAFEKSAGIWEWLKENEKSLDTRKTKKAVLTELHKKLDRKCGDDDISFIWVKPKVIKRSQTNAL